MIKKLKLSEDFYYLFDRLGEGVLFYYEVEYDFKDMIAHNITDQNFKFIPLGIDKGGISYLKKNRINIKGWESDMKAFLLRDNMNRVKENFFEEGFQEIPEDDYTAYENKWLK